MKLGTPIGKGGYGEVFVDADNPTQVIKVLRLASGRSLTKRDVNRFLRGAKIASRLNHPLLVPVTSFGQDQELGPYLVMPRLQGPSLRERMSSPLPALEALQIVKGLAQALAAAHRQGVVHRDLKPENIILTSKGPVLLDLGLAKLVGHWRTESLASLTEAHTLLGSVHYLAPETIPGHEHPEIGLSPRVDVYAWGLILLELLTGQHPYQGPPMAIVGQHARRCPVPIPAPWDKMEVTGLLRSCLEKDPVKRLASGKEVLVELSALMRSDLALAELVGVRARELQEEMLEETLG